MVSFTSILRMGLVSAAAALAGMQGGVAARADDTGGKVESTALGAYEFRNYCASCHGPGGKGDGPLAGMLKVAPSNLTTLSQGNGGTFPRERLKQFIDGRSLVAAHGSRDMPVWGEWFTQDVLNEQLFTSEAVRSLTVDARISGLLVYIESLQAK